MRRTFVVLAVAVVAVTAPASIATAAPPWEPPRTVVRAGAGVSAPAIEFDARGTVLLSWFEGSPASPQSVTRFATLLQDGSVVVWRGQRGVPGADQVPRPQRYGRDRVVLLRDLGRRNRRTGLVRHRLDAVFAATSGATRGHLGSVATFSSLPGHVDAAMDTDDRGEVAVAWVELHGRAFPGTYRVRAALGREDRGFGRPQTLASGIGVDDAPAVTVAYGAGGDLLVAYTTTGRPYRRLVAAHVRRRGRAFGPAELLGPRQAITQLTAAVAPDGRMVVAWASQDGGEDVDRPFVVRAAVRPARGRFGRAQLLDPGESIARPPGRVALGMSSDGRATLAWSNAKDRPFSYPVRTASTGRTGGFGGVTQLAENGGVHDLAVASDGSVVITWSPHDPEQELEPPPLPPAELPAPLYAQVRPSGGAAFGAAELISPPDATVHVADVAYDPRTARPVAVWLPSGASTEIQLAARSG